MSAWHVVSVIVFVLVILVGFATFGYAVLSAWKRDR